jgi:hypothetical protein
MYKLFLDDERKPYDSSWTVVKSYDAFVRHVEENGTPESVSFDHDLSFEHYPFGEQNPGDKIPYDSYKEKTGYHAAKWLVDTGRMEAVAFGYVHTMNLVGRFNILRLLWAARVPHIRIVTWQGHTPLFLYNARVSMLG